MTVLQSKFGFRKISILLNTRDALRIAREKRYYSRVQIVSLVPLPVSGFTLRKRATGVIALDEKYLERFGTSTKNQINRTYREEGFSFKITKELTDEGYALFCKLWEARGMTRFPRDYYNGAMQFLAYMHDEPVSGVLLFPEHPVGLIAGIFSKRYQAKDEEYRAIGNAGKRIMFEVCKWAKENGLTGLDVSGLNLSKTGIAEYKLAFGPVPAEQYVYTYKWWLFGFFETFMLNIRSWQKRLAI